MLLFVTAVARALAPIVGTALAAVLAVALVVLVAFLVVDGVRVLSRDRRSLGHALSAVSAVVVVGMVTALILLFPSRSPAAVVAAALVAVAAYVAVVFCVFLATSFRHGMARIPRRADVVVVLGAGLRDGRVTPLLQGRLDRALEVYRRSAATGTTPLMIPSGGQGDDEPRAEGTAMAEYLVEHGVPPEQVRAETRSTNTCENLALSRIVQEEAGAKGPVVVVTSDYHVQRSAMLARALGIDAEVVGAPTPRRYVPRAFLRELLAVIDAHLWRHAMAVAAIVAVVVVARGVA